MRDTFRRASFAMFRLQDAWLKLQVEIKRDELRNHFALRRARSQDTREDA